MPKILLEFQSFSKYHIEVWNLSVVTTGATETWSFSQSTQLIDSYQDVLKTSTKSTKSVYKKLQTLALICAFKSRFLLKLND